MADRFETTRWSLVLAAARGEEGSVEALEWLCATYWQPLNALIRRRGHDSETARDLTQSFFLTLLDRRSLQRTDPREGRFRSFLLASIRHSLAHEWERQRALKRRTHDPAFRLDFDGAEDHETTGRGEFFRRLSGHLTGDESPYGLLAAELGMTAGALRVAVHRLRRRLGDLLRAEVAHTVTDSGDVQAEIRNLMQAIGRVS